MNDILPFRQGLEQRRREHARRTLDQLDKKPKGSSAHELYDTLHEAFSGDHNGMMAIFTQRRGGGQSLMDMCLVEDYEGALRKLKDFFENLN